MLYAPFNPDAFGRGHRSWRRLHFLPACHELLLQICKGRGALYNGLDVPPISRCFDIDNRPLDLFPKCTLSMSVRAGRVTRRPVTAHVSHG